MSTEQVKPPKVKVVIAVEGQPVQTMIFLAKNLKSAEVLGQNISRYAAALTGIVAAGNSTAEPKPVRPWWEQ